MLKRIIISIFVAICVSHLQADPPATAPATQPAGEHLLTAHDLVSMSIKDLTGPNQTLTLSRRLDADGRISVPLVGVVDAVNLTVIQLAAAIDARYRNAGMLRNAGTSVTLLETADKASVPAGPIKAGDHLEVWGTGLEEPFAEYRKTIGVDANGKVQLPHLDPLNVAGMTEIQAEMAIFRAYQKKQILRNTSLAVTKVKG